MKDLQKLFISELRDIYDGEQRLVEALPEMEARAGSEGLKQAFQEHLGQTRNHVHRLEEVFQEIGEAPKRKSCAGIHGIVHEGKKAAADFAGSPTLDTVLMAAGQKAEHYEIASYGSLCAWAKRLGQDRALQALKENLKEEKQTSERLTALAEAAPPADGKDLRRLFNAQLREMNDAEHLLAQGLAELAFYAVSKPLKFAFRHHLKQTDKHFARVEKVFRTAGLNPDRRRCDGIEGILDEAQTAVMEFLGNSALDAALIAEGQKAEHYEMATYEALCSWARELGDTRAVSLLEDNLREEKRTDKALTFLAELSRNRTAARRDSPKKTEEEAAFAKAITHGP